MRAINRLFIFFLMIACCTAAKSQILISYGSGPNYYVGSFNFDGSPINPTLISGTQPFHDMVNAGDRLFVGTSGGVAEYTLSGQLVNPLLISTSNGASALSYANGSLFVASYDQFQMGSGVIGQYSLSGQPINANLITGVDSPISMAISGTSLYVANYHGGMAGASIGLYTTFGATVNAALITNYIYAPFGLAIYGSLLYVSSERYSTPLPVYGHVDTFSLSGAPHQPNLIATIPSRGIAVANDTIYIAVNTAGYEFPPNGGLVESDLNGNSLLERAGLSGAQRILVVPEPRTWSLVLIGAVVIASVSFKGRRTVRTD
ncbi:MAG: hypothetical protein ACR2HH_01110 [Chthoniobacterales bacterium]